MAETSSGIEEDRDEPPSSAPSQNSDEEKLKLLGYMKNKVITKLLELLGLDVDDYDKTYSYFFWDRIKLRGEKFKIDVLRDVLIEAEKNYYNPKNILNVPLLIYFLQTNEKAIYLKHQRNLNTLEQKWNDVLKEEWELPDIKKALREIKGLLDAIEKTPEEECEGGKSSDATSTTTGGASEPGGEDGSKTTLEVKTPAEDLEGTEELEAPSVEPEIPESTEDVDDAEIYPPEDDDDPEQGDEYLKELLFTVDEDLRGFLPEECQTDDGLQSFVKENYKHLFDNHLHPFFDYLLKKGKWTTKLTEDAAQTQKKRTVMHVEGNLEPADPTKSDFEDAQQMPPEEGIIYVGSGVISFIIERLLIKEKNPKRLGKWKQLNQIRYELIEVYGTWKIIPEKMYQNFVKKLGHIKKVDKKNAFFFRKLNETLMITDDERITDIPTEFFEWLRTKIFDRKFVLNFINMWDKMVFKRLPIATVKFSEDFGKFQVLCSICDNNKETIGWKNDVKKIKRQLMKYEDKFVRLPTTKEMWNSLLKMKMKSFDGMSDIVIRGVLENALIYKYPFAMRLFQASSKEKKNAEHEITSSKEWFYLKILLLASDEVLRTFLPQNYRKDVEIIQFLLTSEFFSETALHPFLQLLLCRLKGNTVIEESKVQKKGKATETLSWTAVAKTKCSDPQTTMDDKFDLGPGNISLIIEHMSKNENFNWGIWNLLQGIRNQLYSTFSTMIGIERSYESTLKKLSDIYIRNGGRKWEDLMKMIQQRVQRKETDIEILRKMCKTTLIKNTSNSYSDISCEFYDWVKTGVNNLYDFDEVRLLLKEKLDQIPFSTLFKSRSYEQFRMLCTIFDSDSKCMEKHKRQVDDMMGILLRMDEMCEGKLFEHIAEDEFQFIDYKWFYKKIVQKACMMSDSSSKFYHSWKRISHQAGSRSFRGFGEKLEDNTTLQKERCLADVFSRVWNQTEEGAIKRVIFMAHGSITSQFINMPTSDNYVTEVKLFPPWGCLLNGSAVQGILNETVKPSHMKIMKYNESSKARQEEKVMRSKKLVSFQKVPSFNAIRSGYEIYNVRLRALNLVSNRYANDGLFINKLADFMKKSKKKANDTIIIPYYSVDKHLAPSLTLAGLALTVENILKEKNQQVTLNVLCCLGKDSKEYHSNFNFIGRDGEHLEIDNYCSVRMLDDTEGDKRQNDKIAMFDDSKSSQSKDNQVTTNALTYLLKGLSPDPKTAKGILKKIYDEYTN